MGAIVRKGMANSAVIATAAPMTTSGRFAILSNSRLPVFVCGSMNSSEGFKLDIVN